jgi:hypothetical protein
VRTPAPPSLPTPHSSAGLTNVQGAGSDPSAPPAATGTKRKAGDLLPAGEQQKRKKAKKAAAAAAAAAAADNQEAPEADGGVAEEPLPRLPPC